MNTWAGDAIQKLNAGGADLGAGIFGVLDKVSKGLESATGGLIPRGGHSRISQIDLRLMRSFPGKVKQIQWQGFHRSLERRGIIWVP